MKQTVFLTGYFFFVFSAFVLTTSGALRSPASRKIASEISTISEIKSCELVTRKKSQAFNPEVFKAELTKLKEQKGVSPEEIQTAMKNPEAFLAIVEYMSEWEAYEGLKFSDLLKDLKPSELKKLHKTIYNATKKDELTEYDFKNLMVTIYRITHRSKGFWKTLWKTKNMQETFDKIDDQKIAERIELDLFNEGMPWAFYSVIKDPGLKVKFKEKLKEYGPWIDASMAVALWGMALASSPENAGPLLEGLKWLPVYIPTLSQYFTLKTTQEQIHKIPEEGFEKGLHKIQSELKSDLKKSRFWSVSRRTYMGVFSVLFLTVIIPAINEKIETDTHDRQQKTYREKMNTLDERVALSLLPLAEQAEIEFQKFMLEFEKSGIKLDPKSELYQKIKKEQYDLYYATYEKQKDP